MIYYEFTIMYRNGLVPRQSMLQRNDFSDQQQERNWIGTGPRKKNNRIKKRRTPLQAALPVEHIIMVSYQWSKFCQLSHPTFSVLTVLRLISWQSHECSVQFFYCLLIGIPEFTAARSAEALPLASIENSNVHG